MKRLSLSLFQKALLLIIVILLPILVAFVYGYLRNRDLFTRHLLEDLTITAESYEGQVYLFLEMNKRRAQDFASDAMIAHDLERASQGDEAYIAELNEHLLRHKLRLHEDIQSISIMALDGRVVASTRGAEAEGRDASKDPAFLEGRSATIVLESADERRVKPEIVISTPITISTPIKSMDTRETIGVLSFSILLSELNKLFSGEFMQNLGALTSGMPKRETMEVYLVNRDRLMITESIFVESAVLRQKADTVPVRACLESSGEVTGFYKDYRGVDIAGASMCIPSMGWTLLVEIDAAEALASVAAMRRDAIITAVIVAGLILFLFTTFFRSVSRRLGRLSAAAKEVAGGGYDVTIPIKAADEIGSLSEAFNSMALEIKTRSAALEMSEESLKEAQHIGHIGNWDWDIVEGTLLWSDEIYSIFGLEPQVFGATYEAFLGAVHPDDRDLVEGSVSRAISEKAPYSIDHRIVLPGGACRVVHEEGKVSFDGSSKPVRMVGTVQDITERKRAEEALRLSETRYRTMLQTASDGIVTMDENQLITGFNATAERLFGYRADEVMGSNVETLMPERYRERHHAAIKRYKKSRHLADHNMPREYEALRKDGTEFPVSLTMSPAEVEGRIIFLAIIRDMTEKRSADLELKKLSTAMEQSVNIVFITDVNGNIEYVNPMFEQVTGYSEEEAIGQNPRILSSGETPDELYEELWSTILSGNTWRYIFKNKKKDEETYWCHAIISPIKNEKGEITNFLAVQEDITEKKISEERIEYLANFDDVTGLINRTRFMELLGEWIEGEGAAGVKGALLFIDIDQFKFLNDTYGHITGDEFLRRLAGLFKTDLDPLYREHVAEGGTELLLSRLSGDEFAIFLPSADETTALEVAEGLRTGVESFRFAEGYSSMTISTGLVIYPEHGTDTRELFTRADAAMYRAKELGRNRCHLYRPEDRDLEKMHSRIQWKERIIKALEEDRFEPWFQPILDLGDNAVHHYEVLARMRDVDGKVLLPGAFIEIAECFGLVGLIDRVIIEKAMQLQAHLKGQGKDMAFSVNLSGKDLEDEDLLNFLWSAIARTEADPGRLVFEITETAAIADLDKAKGFIKALKKLGCLFALDDFGVGFTSFMYLKEMDVDFIKIDGSFIRKLNEDRKDQIFVRSMTEVANGLGIKTIAEFVENGETLELLKEYKVDFAQGYHIGRPGPALAHTPEDLPGP